MLNKVKTYIDKKHLLSKEKRYLVALSGGADSVCLLLMLNQLGYQVEAAHCNFHLRGEESNRDERFVIQLCKSKNIKIHLIHFDTKTYADLHHVSIEMAARELRYRYFEQLRTDIGAAATCVAHHKEDSVETILMNLLRGTGVHGLCGIKPMKDFIIRPLLCLSRKEIEMWLEVQHQQYVTDSSNLTPDIIRNHLRLKVIPLLKEKTPGAIEQILTTARRLNEVARVYDDAIKTTLNRLVHNHSVVIEHLLKEPSPESILYEWLSDYGFSPLVIESIAQGLHGFQAGREWQSDTHLLTVSKGMLILAQNPTERPILHIPENGYYLYDNNEHFRIKTNPGVHILREKESCSLDADKVKFPIIIRPIQQGDRFHPLGMNGSKLVSDYLTDIKQNLIERQRQLVVTTVDNKILWVVGQRLDHQYRIDTFTKNTLTIEHTY